MQYIVLEHGTARPRFEFHVGVTQGRNADTQASEVRSRCIETENVPKAFTDREHVALLTLPILSGRMASYR